MNFKSIGEGEGEAAVGSEPVVSEGSPTASAQRGSDPSTPLNFDSFSPSSGSLGLSPTPSPLPSPGAIPSMADALGLELPEPVSSKDPNQQRKSAGPVSYPAISKRARGEEPSHPPARKELAKPLLPPMPTASEQSAPLWLILVAIVGVGIVIYVVISSS